jgi:protease IV
MRRFVLGLFAAIGVVVVLAAVAAGVVAWRIAASRPHLPERIVLEADLDRGLAEGAGGDALDRLLFGTTPTLRDFLDALERAGGDKRVKGIYLRLGEDKLALPRVQEVRDAIRAFRRQGKFAIAFATGFGEFGPGTRPYYLASACDEIWLQPLAAVGLIGLHTEQPYLRGLLDKLGVEPSFAHREQYKTAMNFLTRHEMTAPEREQIEDLLSRSEGQIVAGIAHDRKLTPERVRALIDGAPLLADEAKSAGLVDRLGYRDEARAAARKRAGGGATLISLSRYLDGAGRPHRSGPKIALIYATGLITERGGASSPLLGNARISADKLGRAFRQAERDKEVRAILLRIDSPGGSAVASETIWREVVQAKARGKPVIVSMGDVAASGGYYIAAPADKIVAEPATLTGSIGVLAGKLVIAGLASKLDVTDETAGRGANAGMFSAFADFSPAARQRLDAFLDATYAGFKDRVARGRHLSPDQVEAIAKGRVWTGAEAKEKGLVDALGGYQTALVLARETAKIPQGQPFQAAVFPRRKSAIERLYDRLTGRNGAADTEMARAALGIASLLSRLDAALGQSNVLRMPAIDIR